MKSKPGRTSYPKTRRGIPLYARGFPSIYVWLHPVEAELRAAALDTKRVEEEISRRLLRAGLNCAFSSQHTGNPQYPCLGILIHGDRSQAFPTAYIFSIEVFYVQRVSKLKPSEVNCLRMLWCREAIGEARCTSKGTDWTQLYQLVGSLVEQFLTEYVGSPDLEVLAPPTH